MQSGAATSCPGCGGLFPDLDGPVHAYVPSSPGCWKTFTEVQAEEMQRFGYPPAHGLVVDSYMAQHPGDGSDRRDRQSVFVHLLGLCAAIEHHIPPPNIRRLFERVLARHCDFPVLERGRSAGRLTVSHMQGTSGLREYEQRAQEWATVVWNSWREEHDVIRAALRAAGQ